MKNTPLKVEKVFGVFLGKQSNSNKQTTKLKTFQSQNEVNISNGTNIKIFERKKEKN